MDSKSKKRRINCRSCALSGICRSCANECHVGHFIAVMDSPTVSSFASNVCQCSAGASCHFTQEISLPTSDGKSTARRSAEALQLIFLSQHYNISSAEWLNQATDDRGFVSALKCISFVGEKVACEELARETARSPFFRSIHVSTKRAMISCLHPRAPDVISTFVSHLPPLDMTESPLGPLPLDAVLFPNVLNWLRNASTLPVSSIVSGGLPNSLSLNSPLTTSTSTTSDFFITSAKELRSFIIEHASSATSSQALQIPLIDIVSVKCYFLPPSVDKKNANSHSNSNFTYRGYVYYISLSTRTSTALIDIQSLLCEDDSSSDIIDDPSLRFGSEAIVEYLSPLFLDKSIVKIMFNSGVELLVIQRELGLYFVNVFDVYTAIDELLLECSEHEPSLESLIPISSQRGDKDDLQITTSLLVQRCSGSETLQSTETRSSTKSMSSSLQLATKVASFSSFSTFMSQFAEETNAKSVLGDKKEEEKRSEWSERPLSSITQEKLIKESKSLLRVGSAAWKLLLLASENSTPSSSITGEPMRFAQTISWTNSSKGRKSALVGTVIDRAILRSQLATLRSPPVNAFQGEHGPPLTIPAWYVPCSFCGQIGSHFSVDCENPMSK